MKNSDMKNKSAAVARLAAVALIAVLAAISCTGKVSVSKPTLLAGWETHSYKNMEAGFALSFDTPADWVATGPLGERQIGGWYNPRYAKPLSPDAVWCYWIACKPPLTEANDPLVITGSQKRVVVRRVEGNWSYHLMCVAPAKIFDEEEAVFNRIMDSFKPLPLKAD